MRKLLLKIFIKDYQNTKDNQVRTKYGTLASIVGIISNIILCVIKIIAGMISGSVSIMADGINNLSDAGSSIVTLIGFRLSSKPADEDHPFGHERIEYLTGGLVSVIIIVIGIILFKDSVQKIFKPENIQVSWLIYVILSFSILIKLWQAFFYRKMGKDIESSALAATSQDSLNDCITTAIALIVVVVLQIFNINIDGYAGVLVSIFVVVSGIKMVKETLDPLIGIIPSKEMVKDISDKVLSYEGILGVHDLVIHSYGPNKTFATIHAEVSSTVPIMISHDTIDNIERDFRVEYNIDLVIHMDPVDISDPKTLAYRDLVQSILIDLDPNLSMHDFRVVHGVSHTNLLFDVVLPIKYHHTAQEVRELIIKNIKEKDDHLEAIIQIDQFYNRNN